MLGLAVEQRRNQLARGGLARARGPFEPGGLYRVRASVRSDEAEPGRVPELRLRLNLEDEQLAALSTYPSIGFGRWSPTPGGREYDVYLTLPAWAPAASMGYVSFDLLNFHPDDAPEAALFLDRLEVCRVNLFP